MWNHLWNRFCRQVRHITSTFNHIKNCDVSVQMKIQPLSSRGSISDPDECFVFFSPGLSRWRANPLFLPRLSLEAGGLPRYFDLGDTAVEEYPPNNTHGAANPHLSCAFPRIGHWCHPFFVRARVLGKTDRFLEKLIFVYVMSHLKPSLFFLLLFVNVFECYQFHNQSIYFGKLGHFRWFSKL